MQQQKKKADTEEEQAETQGQDPGASGALDQSAEGGEQEDGVFSKIKGFFKGKKKEKTKEDEKKEKTEPVSKDETPKSTPTPPPTPEKTPAEMLAELLKKGGGELSSAWSSADAKQRAAMATLIKTTDVTDDALKLVFDATPDGELATLTKIFEKRFDVQVGVTLNNSKTAKAWDVEGIRRCYALLKDLPDEHVRGNKWLEHWTRYDGGGDGAGGYYSGGRKESSVTYDKDHIDDANTSAHVGDPLYGVVRFNKVVRHEVGHAVDKKIGAEASLCIGNAQGGDWKKHGAPTKALVEEMVAAGSTAIKSQKAEHQTAIIDAILAAMVAGKPADTAKNIKKLDIFKAKDDKTPAVLDGTVLASVLGDPVVTTSEKCGADKSPWYRLGDLGIDLGGRHYQVDYGKTWVSYSKAALARKVSTYQFRAPGEWFAEAYATYFEPDNANKVGTTLNARDPGTKTWFDTNVLPQEKKETPEVSKDKAPPSPEGKKEGGDKGG